MKKWLMSFMLFATIVLFITPAPANGRVYHKTFIASGIGIKPPLILNDTIPKKINLFQKFVNFLKFKKNIRNAEKERILAVIQSTFFKDSIMANARDIRMLNDALTDTVNQKFDSLVSLINAIQLSEEEANKLPHRDTADIIYNTIVNDSVLNDLLNKILPILETKAQENKNTIGELSLLKNLQYFYGRVKKPVDTFPGPGFNEGLRLERKAPVYAFFPAGMGGNYLDYNFNVINTLIYDGYALDGQTGRCTDLGSGAATNVLESARQAGCKVLLTVRGMSPRNMAVFLQNKNGQEEALIGYALALIQQQHANGVNIQFSGLDSRYRQSFATFINTLSDTLMNACPGCRMIITIPPGNANSAYEINRLNNPNVKFLIDFSENYPGRSSGPIVPLKGDNGNGIEPTVSRYLNSNVPPSKFILGLPYYGAQWAIIPGINSSRFVKYLALDEITSHFTEPTLYDPETAATFINVMNMGKQLTGQIWYNDAKVLNNIYDFILQNGLGGLAVQPLQTKIGYSKIWTGIGNKFLKIDTLHFMMSLFVPAMELYMDSIKKEPFAVSWKYFKGYDSLFEKTYYLLEHPCEKDFIPGETDESALKDPLAKEAVLKSRVEFFRTSRIVQDFFAVVALFLLLVFVGFGYGYIYKIRKKGRSWKSRKIAGAFLILLAALLIFFSFLFMFVSDAFPGFGPSYNHCYNIPFQILLLIIISGIIVGVLVMRYLIFPLVKKDDLP
ncbi:MAG: glycoside hydrolase family 18 protein [Chitinophagaceae bacterium]|nr:MAG: glycoside hydrolase family 18 protein [Chitinophagaceae bacterium]